MDDELFALPEITDLELVNMIVEVYADEDTVVTFAKLYGWLYPQMLEEIRSIAAGSLAGLLVGRPRDEAVSEYFNIVEGTHPALVDSMIENLGKIFVITNAPQEGEYSDIREKGHTLCDDKTTIRNYGDVKRDRRPLNGIN